MLRSRWISNIFFLITLCCRHLCIIRAYLFNIFLKPTLTRLICDGNFCNLNKVCCLVPQWYPSPNLRMPQKKHIERVKIHKKPNYFPLYCVPCFLFFFVFPFRHFWFSFTCCFYQVGWLKSAVQVNSVAGKIFWSFCRYC